MNESQMKILQELNIEKQELESKGETLSSERMRQWEYLTMLKSVEEQKASVQKQDEAFFGWIAPEKTRGEIVQQAITNQVPVSKKKDTETVSYSPLTSMNDINKRYSMVTMYALTQGMTLDQVLSDDPQYDKQKAEIGEKFIKSITFMDRAAYADYHKSAYLGNEKNIKHIEDLCNIWFDTIEKDGIQVKRPSKMAGRMDLIMFVGDRCKEYWKTRDAGHNQMSKSDFIKQMQTTGMKEYADQRDFGENYFGYLDDHNLKVNEMLQEMHGAFAKIPADFMQKNDIQTLAQNMKIIALISEVSTDLELCRHEDVLKATYDEDENTNELDEMETLTEDIRPIGVIKSYCDYVASEAYTLNEHATKAEYEWIQEGYWSKLQMDAVADQCKTKKTLGEVGRELHTYNAGGIIDKQKKEFKDAMMYAGLHDDMWAAKANEYIGTGKNPLHLYDSLKQTYRVPKSVPEKTDDEVIQQAQDVQERVLSQRKAEEKLSEKKVNDESRLEWKDWMDFETFDMVETGEYDKEGKAIKNVDMKSVRTMSWKDLEAEEKQAKTDGKKSVKPNQVMSEEKKKVKEAPKKERKAGKF